MTEAASNARLDAGTGIDWRELVDPAALSAWMDTQGLGAGPVLNARALAGGTQNLLLQFEQGGAHYVLRRPLRHPRPGANETTLREARVLAALQDTPVPRPDFIAVCADPGVLGAAFYLMAPVDGISVASGLPPLHAASPALRHRMGLAMVDAIQTLAALDPQALGLGDFGKADGFLARQVPRWHKQYEDYAKYAGWSGPQSLPGLQAVGDWLEAHRPATFTPGLLHGDFHIANVMFRHDSGELAAIIDWEMATVGDPLLDLGWLIATWPQPDGSHHRPHHVHPWPGFPTAQELIERYAAGSPRDLSAFHWYVVLACFKLGVVLEGTHARACAGLVPHAVGQQLHVAAIGLLRKARTWIETH